MTALLEKLESMWVDAPQSVRIAAAFAVVTMILFKPIFQDGWTGNEVNYFDLAYWWTSPEGHSENHAVFDESRARVVSFTLMGWFISAFGFEGAEILLSFVVLLLLSASYVFLARAMRVELLGFALVLLVFLAAKQGLIGKEWIFMGVEGKVFAYICVFFGLGFALKDRRYLAVCLSAAGAYFHFLVGGGWGAAALGLFLIRDRSFTSIWRETALFAALCFPLVLLIILDRIGGPEVDESTLPHSVNYIYSHLANPFHMAPFYYWKTFLFDWLPGFVLHIAIAVVAYILYIKKPEGDRSETLWILLLNLYFFLAMFVAFIDRDTHYLSKFYLFRPSSLVLLLSLLWGCREFIQEIWSKRHSTMAVVVSILLVAYVGPQFLKGVLLGTVDRRTLADWMTADQAKMVQWIKAETPEDAVVVLEPANKDILMGGDVDIGSLGLERLTGRPTLINSKFLPTAAADVARWYRLLEWRADVFDGSCEKAASGAADYLVTRTEESKTALAVCTETVWTGESLSVLKVARVEG